MDWKQLAMRLLMSEEKEPEGRALKEILLPMVLEFAKKLENLKEYPIQLDYSEADHSEGEEESYGTDGSPGEENLLDDENDHNGEDGEDDENSHTEEDDDDHADDEIKDERSRMLSAIQQLPWFLLDKEDASARQVYQCHFRTCGKHFDTVESWESHMLNKHLDIHQCMACEERSNRTKAMHSHVGDAHENSLEPISDGRPAKRPRLSGLTTGKDTQL